MTDQDDVRHRVEEALRRAAATAYEAAHGAIDEPYEPPGPARWRLFATPRVVVTVALVLALVGALVAFMPRAEPRSPATVTWDSDPGPTVQGTVEADGEVTVTVHVLGQVVSPGVYAVQAGGRVQDAVAAAGGATQDADLGGVNLARIVSDGEQVRVPAMGEASMPDASMPHASMQGNLINVNSADAVTLERLPGVGPVLAARIVAYRQENGPFASVDALDAVSGVGPAVLEGLRATATV